MSTTNNRLTAEELQKLRQTDFSKKQGFVKAETVLGKEVGEVGTPEREEFDARLVHGIMAKCCGSGAKNSV